MWGQTFDGFHTLSQEQPGESFCYDPPGHEGLQEEPLDVFRGRHNGVISREIIPHATRLGTALVT